MAVDTDDGLLVPVLHNAAQLSLIELAAKSRQLVGQARAGKLAAADMRDPFSPSRIWAHSGSTPSHRSSTFQKPQFWVWGAIRREPVALDDGGIVSRHQLTLSLTFDHRILDGAPAARFLQNIATAIANPSAALLS